MKSLSESNEQSEDSGHELISEALVKDEYAQTTEGPMGHPKGLYTLFNLELWERFSYFGFQAILVLYLSDAIANGGLGYDENVASSIVAAYGALLYLLSIGGAWIADRVAGTQKPVLWGSIIIAGGHIAMAIPAELFTWVGLGFIIVGTGLLKPNVSTKVGELYKPNDDRRDAGFAIYYAGINIGVFLGPIIAGWLGQRVHWHAGFGAAAVGMIVGIILYIYQSRYLAGNEAAVRTRLNFKADRNFWSVVVLVAAVIVVAAIFGGTGLVKLDGFINVITAVTIVVPIIYLTWMYKSSKVTTEERRNLGPYVFLLIALVMYNLTYFQTGNTLNLLALNHTNNLVAGFEYPSTWYISLTAIVEIIMGPVIAWAWFKLGKRQPHVAAKVGIGVIFGGFAFIWVALGGMATPFGSLMNPLWLVACYVFLGLGDLLVQTSGMSATTKLAPRAFVSQTMAVWFAAMAMVQGLQAQIVKLFESDGSNQVLYFGIQGVIIIGYGVFLIALTPWMKKRMTNL